MADTREPNHPKSHLKTPEFDNNYKRTINERIRELAREAPDKVAFVFRSPNEPRSSLTRQEFLDKVTLLGLHFVHLGIKPGDKVAILMPSCEYFLIIQFGLHMAGAVAVNSLSQNENEINKLSSDLGCAATVVKQMSSSETREPQDELTRIYISLRQKDSSYRFAADVVSLLQIVVPDKVFLPEVPANARVLMLLTSGSTGAQKLVTHTHSTLLFGAFSFANGTQYKSTDAQVNDRPMQWIGGYPLVYLGAGSTVIYAISQIGNSGNDEFFVNVLLSENPTSAIMMEYRLNGIYSQPELLAKMPRLQSVFVSGQRVTPRNVRLLLKLCDEVKVLYGSTECVNICAAVFRDPDSFEDGTVGAFGRGSEVKIVNEKIEIVSVLEEGELCIRGDGCSKEYVNMEGKTGQVLDNDNWYHTGDMATMNSDGIVSIKGRKTEIIKRAVVNIFPAVIERKLQENFDVHEVAVVGIPDKRLYREVCACIILKKGSTLTLASIRRKAEKIFQPSLAPDGIGLMPGHFLIMDDFPRTFSFKCIKSQLAEIAEELLKSGV